MKLKVQHLMDATLIISQIIREDRPLPQKGKYRLARIHPKLNAEFMVINTRRDEMIKAYDFHPMVPNPAYNPEVSVEDAANNVVTLEPKMIPSIEWSVPLDKLDEFQKTWMEIAAEEIEVDVQPIPLDQLCFADDREASISAHEFIILGDLVAE